MSVVPTEELLRPIKDNIRKAREHRKSFEAIWQSNMAYASGQHWLVWDNNFRALRRIQEVNPKFRNRELYQGDQITEIRTHVLGELGSDDDRPELLLQRDDRASEDFQSQVNRALGYGWDYEWDGDTALAEVDRMMIDLGTAGMQCYYDATAGQVKYENVPHLGGKPLLEPDRAVQAVAASYLGGPQVEHKDVRAGRICWRPLSSLNLLPPPGITHERYFPWECIVRPLPIETVRAIFDYQGELREDTDIASTLGAAAIGATGSASAYGATEARKGTLRGHVWVFSYYVTPTPKNPQGRVFHFAGNDLRLLRVDNELPYVAPDGTYRSGISYFHWWRVTGRFWSRSLVEGLKHGQRAYDKRRTQINEMIDRGLPYTLVQTGSTALKRTDLPMELVEIDRSEQAPVHVQGFSGGQWMYDELKQIQDDMERASGVRNVALGTNPPNVQNYSQLALLREADQVKRSPIYRERKLSIARLVEDSVYDMKTYWGGDKQVMLAGDDDSVEAFSFNANKIPAFFIVKVAKGTAKPRSQAAELQKIKDLLDYSAAAGQPLPVSWAKDSYERGQPAELPDSPTDDQQEKAERENHRLLLGEEIPVAYYDPPETHIPIHRKAQIEAEQVGNVQAWTRIEQHVQEHLNIQQELAAQFQAEQVPSEAPPGAPGPPPVTQPQPQGAADGSQAG
jgi:hypothetical protein